MDSPTTRVVASEYFLPELVLTNDHLAKEFPEWSVDKIFDKTGIRSRHIAGEDEFSSDLAYEAASKLLDAQSVKPEDVDFLILCTQSPDFYLPTTACIVHERLGLPSRAGAVDVNLGCSGFVYSLGLAKGMIESQQAKRVLVVTADTYSKFINDQDKSVRTIFGDAGSATLLEASFIGGSVSRGIFGTDGSGAKSLIVPSGGLRSGFTMSPKSDPSKRDIPSSEYDLYMDGPGIFSFTISAVPSALQDTLDRAGLSEREIDLFVFHQANKFMLEHLRKSLDIPEEKFFVDIEDIGNTVSSTIPIALSRAMKQGKIKPGSKVLTLGFGVGLSWAGNVITF